MITNVAKVSSSLSNATKIVDFETWASIQTTWASETRTWAETATLLDNTSRVTSTITNIARP